MGDRCSVRLTPESLLSVSSLASVRKRPTCRLAETRNKDEPTGGQTMIPFSLASTPEESESCLGLSSELCRQTSCPRALGQDPSRRLFVEMASFSNYWKRKGPVTRRTCFLLHVAGNSVRRSQERQRKRSQRKENRNEM